MRAGGRLPGGLGAHTEEPLVGLDPAPLLLINYFFSYFNWRVITLL